MKPQHSIGDAIDIDLVGDQEDFFTMSLYQTDDNKTCHFQYTCRVEDRKVIVEDVKLIETTSPIRTHIFKFEWTIAMPQETNPQSQPPPPPPLEP